MIGNIFSWIQHDTFRSVATCNTAMVYTARRLCRTPNFIWLLPKTSKDKFGWSDSIIVIVFLNVKRAQRCMTGCRRPIDAQTYMTNYGEEGIGLIKLQDYDLITQVINLTNIGCYINSDLAKTNLEPSFHLAKMEFKVS